MISPITTIATLWAIWVAGWVVTSGSTAKTVFQESGASRLTYSVFVWAGAILLFVQPTTVPAFTRLLFTPSAWADWGGVALVALGLGIAAWARAHLGRLWSGTVTLKEHHTIVRTGPYAFVRHPIYTGLTLATAGTALTKGTFAALAGFALLITSFVIKIRQEEALLISHFGKAYEAYQKEVSGLIPYIW
jgi:protein-S-isoprenylcysteine O-methyltransferase Ste14